jgi:hypothetical protein
VINRFRQHGRSAATQAATIYSTFGHAPQVVTHVRFRQLQQPRDLGFAAALLGKSLDGHANLLIDSRHAAPRFGKQQATAIRPAKLSVALAQFKRVAVQEVEAWAAAEYEAKIAALERKVGQLTMELELLKKTPRLQLVTSNESCSIVSGSKAAPCEEGAK